MKNIKDEKRVMFKVFNQSTLRKKGEERRKQADGLNWWRFMSERVDVDRESSEDDGESVRLWKLKMI